MLESYKYIDLGYLRDFSNGDGKFMKEIISISIEQTDNEIINLKNALAEKEYKKISQICHKLRSSMGFMGISKELIEELKQIENLSIKNKGTFKSGTEHIIKTCSFINKELRDELEKLKTIKKTP